MFKRINWKPLLKCFAWILCLGGIVTLMSFVEAKKHTVKCTNIKILIPGSDNFIEREEIDAILKQNEGQLIGRNLENINLNAIEGKIKSNPYIALSTVYADMDGVIHIEISQRQPLLRIINAGGQDYYIDRDGLKMPVSPNFTANVLVANGHILEHFSGKVDTLITKMASDLYQTAKFIKRDTLWDAQIEQIFVNDRDDIELVPRVGNQRIILGTADSLENKMANLLVFYKKAMPQVGWDTYKTINVKYANQIVCERNKPDSLHAALSLRSVKPTIAGARKVTDSIVKAEIAAELRNNPEEAGNNISPEARPVARPAVSIPAKPPVKKTVVPPAVHKKEVRPEAARAAKTAGQAAHTLPASHLPASKPVKKETAAEKKTAAPPEKKTGKSAESKSPKKTGETEAHKTVKTTEKKTANTAEHKPPKAVAATAKPKSKHFPEIKWVKPAATTTTTTNKNK